MLATIQLANVVRFLVIFSGGIVIGSGFVILTTRAKWYDRLGLPEGARAMRVLAVMNALVLAFVTGALLDRWDQSLSWRTPAAAIIFATKGLFFHLLRQAGLEQERRMMRGDFR